MLKVLSSSCFQGRLQSVFARFPAAVGHGGEGRSPLFRVLGSLRNPSGGSPVFGRRVFFYSESSDGSDPPPAEDASASAVEGGGAEEAESKASSAIIPTNPRPEDYLTVGVL